MAKKIAAAAVAVVETVKRFTRTCRLNGGDGAVVKVNLREGKTGGFNLSTTLKEPGAEKAVTGATSTEPTKEGAMEAFDKIVAVAIEHGWVKKEKKVRVPKAPAFTVETFPMAKPFDPNAPAALAFPKKATKKGAKK